MENLIIEISNRLKKGKSINDEKLASIIRASNRGKLPNQKQNAKKYLLPYYLDVKQNNPSKYKSWNIDENIEKQLMSILQVKPKRSASGVATITLITKPWKCRGNCIFCPNDIRMPKSYLSEEPACQRAERSYFDPYLQVATRLKVLHEMGHATDKVEIIILGGTWNDYTLNYQKWCIQQVFKALNDGVYGVEINKEYFNKRESFYKEIGISCDTEKLKLETKDLQQKINSQNLSYNQAFDEKYSESYAWNKASDMQKCSWEEVFDEHKSNEDARHRCVGLVVETRPSAINVENLTIMRKLGCTKVQIGVQSLDSSKMSASERSTDNDTVTDAFQLLRLYGFKIHGHFMVNLPKATPQSDVEDYEKFVTSSNYLPDEIKLYPCMLVKSARLNKLANSGKWKAYEEEELTKVLVKDVLATPNYTRISRMMRDISSKDITSGVKKTNLRQMVENRAEKICKETNTDITEIRHREISMSNTDVTTFKLKDTEYETKCSLEHFIEYITKQNNILGFCRLSLPKQEYIKNIKNLPILPGQAMIRELHVYGKVAKIGKESTNAQHLGLGKELLNYASEVAKKSGYTKINVISAIGTRNYYKKRGFNTFSNDGLYQQKELV